MNKGKFDENKPEDLGCGCLGNGTTIWDRNRRSGSNDYLTVAHISENATTLTLYGHRLSYLALCEIERMVIDEIRKSHANVPKWNKTSIPVIVEQETPTGSGKYKKISYGVQFWTPDMIDKREALNTDGTESLYVSLLQTIEYGEGEHRVWLTDWVNFFGDKFSVNTECQPDYFPAFTRALEFFEGHLPLDYKP